MTLSDKLGTYAVASRGLDPSVEAGLELAAVREREGMVASCDRLQEVNSIRHIKCFQR